MKKTIVLILMTVLFLTASFAQFGKNKIREDQFDWKIYSTENFDI